MSTTSDGPKKKPTADGEDGARFRTLVREVTQSPALVVIFAIVASLIIGSLLVVFSDDAVGEATSASAWFAAAGDALGQTYSGLFRGAIFNPDGADLGDKIRPFTSTLTFATPLIFAGLGLGIGFRAGLFNIGAKGQMLIGAALGGYIGFAWDLPPVLHLVVAILGCMIAGALWGSIPGLLRALTGAHEVITTIMLNFVALYLVAYLLSREAFQRPGTDNPQSPLVRDNAEYPELLNWGPFAGENFRLHLGFFLALAAAWGVWWLMERSTWGFQFRAVGANPSAAKTAGMSVKRAYILVFGFAGALAGLAASAQILGTEKSLTENIAGSVGFDAITVALLGRSRPTGIVLAALLFGGLRASSSLLQFEAGLPKEIVFVLQSLIVLFIAAPPLVRFLFRLPAPAREKEVTA